MATTFELENSTPGIVIGVDEVGRGPWAGPVVAAAFYGIADKLCQNVLKIVNDSKVLNAKVREDLYSYFYTENGISCQYALGQASVEEIDSLNIRQATFLAMQRAVEALSLKPALILVDGNASPDFTVPSLPIIKGDQKSFSIAAASIIAKVERDRYMVKLAQAYPGYGWEKNAGYGTKAHQEGLDTHGVTPHHRKSFAPIKTRLQDVFERAL